VSENGVSAYLTRGAIHKSLGKRRGHGSGTSKLRGASRGDTRGLRKKRGEEPNRSGRTVRENGASEGKGTWEKVTRGKVETCREVGKVTVLRWGVR